MTPDRRKNTRWEIERQVKIQLAGAEKCADCLIKDLNLKGIQVALSMKLPKDAFMRMSFFLADDFVLHVEAWVAWHKTLDEHNLYGLVFSKIQDSDREKIYRFLRRDFAGQLDEKLREKPKEGGEKMANGRIDDRRIFERFPARLKARFINTDSNQEGTAHTQDISAKGIRLLARELLPVNASVELWLDVPDKGEPLYTRGQVVWSRNEGSDAFHTGICLEKADLMEISRVLRTI